MPSFPRTLIQIHYHDRPCGVTQVMRHYAEAFRSINSEAEPWLVCSHNRKNRCPEFSHNTILNLPDADYRVFLSQKPFLTARDSLMERLLDLLVSPRIKKPVAIVAHNLTLGKNAALMSAFAALSRSILLTKNGCRFFSVAHDLAEEGRVEQLSSIRDLEMLDIPIRDDIRMLGGAVRHVTVNQKVFQLFKRAGLPVSFLGNPVVAEKAGACNALWRLISHCKRNRIPFDHSLPIYTYPARTIARKNTLEAVLLGCLLLEGNLLLGPSGGTSADRRMHDAIRKLGREYHLPIVTDVQEIFEKDGTVEVMSAVYGVSNIILTTSVAEGFGYLFFEPFLYKKPVLGRRPSGFKYPAAIRNPLLYEQLPVPAMWISQKRNRQFNGKHFTDFALLNDASQLAFIRKVLSSRNIMAELLRLLERPHAGWPGLPALRRGCSAACIERNRAIILKQYSMQRFIREFRKCFSIKPSLTPFLINENLFLKSFRDPRTFRIR